MSRFTPSRRNRVLAWTGAALAWGTAVTAARLEPARAQTQAPTPTTPVVNQATTQAAMPTEPVGGLVILRYQPHEEPTPAVRTVYVKKTTPAKTTAPAKAAPAPKKTAPAPKSRGS
jgi:hypothetical protein